MTGVHVRGLLFVIFCLKKELQFTPIDVIFSFVDKTIGTRIHSGMECDCSADSLEK